MRRLVIQHGGIGDCILSLPAIEHLKNGCDYFEVWVPYPVVPLIRADRIRSLEAMGLFLIKDPRAERDPSQLLTTQLSRTNLLEAMRDFDSIISWFGPDIFVEFCSKNKIEVTWLDSAVWKAPGHVADNFLKSVGGSGAAIPFIQCVHMPIGSHIVMYPFSSYKEKNWSFDNYLRLADEIKYPIEVFTGPLQVIPNGHLMRGGYIRCLSITETGRMPVRFDNLYLFGAWLTSSRLYIGNDTGITHVAAAIGVPTICIFNGSTDAGKWSPRGIGKICVMQNPTVKQVAMKVEEFYDSYGTGDCISTANDNIAQSAR
jgi:heptosyltransferase III